MSTGDTMNDPFYNPFHEDIVYSAEPQYYDMPESSNDFSSILNPSTNTMLKIQIKKLTTTARVPTKSHEWDAGWDLYADVSANIEPHKRLTISTGIAIAIPEGYVGLIWPRSGLAVKQGIDVLAGVIDSQYRGELKVCLYNTNGLWSEHNMGNEHINRDMSVSINQGDRIAQLLIQEIPKTEFKLVQELSETTRSQKGFGSSGK